VQTPSDQRIHEDAFLTCKFWGRFNVLGNAIIGNRLPNYFDYIRATARGKLSDELLWKECPDLREAMNARCKGIVPALERLCANPNQKMQWQFSGGLKYLLKMP